MDAKTLRWVFHVYRDNVDFFLANGENHPLGYPFLRNLSKEEINFLESLGIVCSPDPGSRYYTDVYPKKPRELVKITAPAYIEVHMGKNVEYQKIGEYTGEWTDLRDYQFVNKAVIDNIPSCKIHIPGYYVSVSE